MPDRNQKKLRPARGSSGNAPEKTYVSSYEEQLAAGTALLDMPQEEEAPPRKITPSSAMALRRLA